MPDSSSSQCQPRTEWLRPSSSHSLPPRPLRHSVYENTIRHDRASSPVSSTSSPPESYIDRTTSHCSFALTSAHWSDSSQDESDNSDDVDDDDASYSPSKRQLFIHPPHLPIRPILHRNSVSSSYPPSHSVIELAPRIIQPPPGPHSSAPPPHYGPVQTLRQTSSHDERHSFPPSLDRSFSAAPSASRLRHGSPLPFSRTPSAGFDSSLRRSNPTERKVYTESVDSFAPLQTVASPSRTPLRKTGRSSRRGKQDPAENDNHEELDEYFRPLSSKRERESVCHEKVVFMTRTTMASSAVKRPTPDDDDNGDDDDDDDGDDDGNVGVARLRWRVRPPESDIAVHFEGPTPVRKKRSNAGRTEVPIGLVKGERRYLCPAKPPCSGHFSRKNDAYRHLDGRHGLGRDRYVCGCGRRLSRKDALHRHYATCQWVKDNRQLLQNVEVHDEDADAEGESVDGEGDIDDDQIEVEDVNRVEVSTREKTKEREKNQTAGDRVDLEKDGEAKGIPQHNGYGLVAYNGGKI